MADGDQRRNDKRRSAWCQAVMGPPAYSGSPMARKAAPSLVKEMEREAFILEGLRAR